jgi:hypothetical protein
MCLCSQVEQLFLISIDIKVNTYFISDPEGQYGENLVGNLLFSKFGDDSQPNSMQRVLLGQLVMLCGTG